MTALRSFGRIAFLGGYIPRRCGIATFTHDLREAVSSSHPEMECIACAVNDPEQAYDYPAEVMIQIEQNDLSSYLRAADALQSQGADVLSVQHEFGIYGGRAGEYLLDLLKAVKMPVITTLHTVLREPNENQHRVMLELIARSDRLVIMAEIGREILHEVYEVPDEKIDVIFHGIPDVPFVDTHESKWQLGLEGKSVLLSFGLLGPSKGIEYVIEALPAIVKKHPEVVYLVLGATHPHLLARNGEEYRHRLEELAARLGVKENVVFYNRFVSQTELGKFIAASDVYVTAYQNEAQITSGTLAYVYGAGRAVVSTPYWHARELLANDRGVLVPFQDTSSIATGVCLYLDDPKLLNRIQKQAYIHGRSMIWSVIAEQYVRTFQLAVSENNNSSYISASSEVVKVS